jgi:transposase
MLPFPSPKSVLVMDNAQIYYNGRVAEILESQGCLLLYLPPYSPDLNPIEKGFSIYKSAVKQFEQLRTDGDNNYDVINEFVCLVFTLDIIKKLFRGSGYAV